MTMEQITIDFDLDNEMDKKIYWVVKHLSSHYKKFYDLNDLTESEALIMYLNDLGNSLLECEDRKEKCEKILDLYSRKQVQH